MSGTISIAEFGRLAGVSESTAYRWYRIGKLDSIDAGKRHLDRSAAAEWVKRNVKTQAKP